MSKIYIDKKEDFKFIISGNIDILQNSRNKLMLMSLGYEVINSSIVINYTENSQINIIEELKLMAEQSGLIIEYSEPVKNLISSYIREQEYFQEFSNNARNIREDKFEDNPELIEGFEEFKDVLKNKLVRKLYKRQMLSAYHMAFSQNACNFAVPGAGKTSIVYGAFAYLKSLPAEHPKHVDILLVIGPTSSFDPWEEQFEECFGVFPKSERLSGDSSITKVQRDNYLYSKSPKELTLMSHSALQYITKEVKDFLSQNKAMVVIDEAHRIKNAEGVWGKAAIEISKDADARIILTGTPAPYGYEDLYNLIKFIYPYKFQEIMRIHHNQLRELTKSGLTVQDNKVNNFVENIKPFFIRINKKELNLPDPKEQTVKVSMDSLHRKIYDSVFDTYRPQLEANPKATVADVINKAKILRLRQAATNPTLLLKPFVETLELSKDGDGFDQNSIYQNLNMEFDDSDLIEDIMLYKETNIPKKFVAIKDIYEKKILPFGGKVIVWTIFIQNAFEFQKYLLNFGIESKLLIGSVEQGEREEIIRKFNNPNNNDFNIVIANPFTVSESISLHKGCQNAIYMERDYNAANFIQSKNRIHRVGMPDGLTANYYYLISEVSIDETIDDRLSERVIRMEEIIDQEIRLFDRVNNDDEDYTDIITGLLDSYYAK